MFGWLRRLFTRSEQQETGTWEIFFRYGNKKEEISLGTFEGSDVDAMQEAELRYVNYLWRKTEQLKDGPVCGEYYIKPVERRNEHRSI